MMNVRNILIGLVVSALLAGIVVSCGGGYGGGGTSMYTYTVGGTITGATGTVTLKLNGGSDIQKTGAGAQPFTFAEMIANGSTYNVQVVAADQRCTVANGAGTMGAANITNVAVTCGVQGTQMVIRSALLNGAQESPPVTTAATGVGGVIVNPTTKEITGGITFTGLTDVPTGAHIHRANGDVAIALVLAADNATATIPAGTTVATGPVLIDADYAELLAGTLYFNVHTAMNSGGEIRGQINLQGGVLAGLAALDGTQAQTASTAVGRGAVVVDSATRQILTGYATHNVISPSAAHIHTSAPTRDGNIEVGLTLGTNVVTASQGAMFTATDVQDLNANYLYFNIHSANCMTCGGGEIRGQILAQ